MSGIIREKNQKAIIVNGVANHVHAFVGLKPAMQIADLVRDVKNNSTRFINEKGWLPKRFQWQSGYGAFSYGHSQFRKRSYHPFGVFWGRYHSWAIIIAPLQGFAKNKSFDACCILKTSTSKKIWPSFFKG